MTTPRRLRQLTRQLTRATSYLARALSGPRLKQRELRAITYDNGQWVAKGRKARETARKRRLAQRTRRAIQRRSR